MLRHIEREAIILNAGDYVRFLIFGCGGLCVVFNFWMRGIMCGFIIVGCGGLCQVFETRYRCFYAKHKNPLEGKSP